MDSTGPREGGGAMKPVILRVGVALVLSATGLIFARFGSWKEDKEVTSCASHPESSSPPSRNNNDGKEEEKESLVDRQNREIISLNSRLEELQRKDNDKELRFKSYRNLKDQEAMLMEQKSMLVLEKSQLDFFRREVSAMEEEFKRGKDLVIVYSKQVGEIQEFGSKNRLLEGEANKLRIRVKHLHRVVNQKSRKSVKKLLKCLHKLGKKNNVVKELEGQVKGLKANLDILQEEKEVDVKSSENSEMVISVEDHRRALEENEDLNTRIIYLRWINGCLRKELMRNETKYEGALALKVVADGHHDWGKKFIKNLKRCVGGHSGAVEADEEGMLHSRR